MPWFRDVPLDFALEETRQAVLIFTSAYDTRIEAERLARWAGLDPANIEWQPAMDASMEKLFEAASAAAKLEELLAELLDDHTRKAYAVQLSALLGSHLAEVQSRLAYATTEEERKVPVQLLCATLLRDLGGDGESLARKLVEILSVRHEVRGGRLVDATRFAIEYHLLTADDPGSTVLVEVAEGKRECDPKLAMFRDRMKRARELGSFAEVSVFVPAESFFTRTRAREEDWHRYFRAVRTLCQIDRPGTLCKVRLHGFVAPQYLVTGLLSRFDDDWGPPITVYEDQMGKGRGAFASLQASQWNTWLMWGPSIPLCTCEEWTGVRALQYGFGDENNSIPVIGGDDARPETPTALEALFDSGAGACSRARPQNVTGRLRWAPWLLARGPQSDAELDSDDSGIAQASSVPKAAAARAQRLIYENGREETRVDGLVLQLEDLKKTDRRTSSYFSAYLWVMFLVARAPATAGAAPRRLEDDYPPPNARAADRRRERLWRELVPVFVHANVADEAALRIQQRALVDNTFALLRGIWDRRGEFFPGVDAEQLRFQLVGTSDYSGCGHALRFPPASSIVEQLRAKLLEPSNAALTDVVVLPPPGETAGTRPRELVECYATCQLPELISDYYAYVVDLGKD